MSCHFLLVTGTAAEPVHPRLAARQVRSRHRISVIRETGAPQNGSIMGGVHTFWPLARPMAK
jgi:hypothetical protein